MPPLFLLPQLRQELTNSANGETGEFMISHVKRSSHSCSWARHFTKSWSTCLKTKSNIITTTLFILLHDNQLRTANILVGSSFGRWRGTAYVMLHICISDRNCKNMASVIQRSVPRSRRLDFPPPHFLQYQ